MRFNLVGLIIGQRGTGKTSFIKGDKAVNVQGLIQIYQKKNGGRKEKAQAINVVIFWGG